MTDRFNALTVVLDDNVREDDAQALIAAIGQLRGVLTVTGNVAGIDSYVAEQRVRHELSHKVLDLLRPGSASGR